MLSNPTSRNWFRLMLVVQIVVEAGCVSIPRTSSDATDSSAPQLDTASKMEMVAKCERMNARRIALLNVAAAGEALTDLDWYIVLAQVNKSVSYMYVIYVYESDAFGLDKVLQLLGKPDYSDTRGEYITYSNKLLNPITGRTEPLRIEFGMLGVLKVNGRGFTSFMWDL